VTTLEINYLKILWNETYEALMKKRIFIVCNTKSESHITVPEQSKIATEYFSDDEFEEIASMFAALDIPMDFFTYEDNFIRHILNNPNEKWSDYLVYNAAQSGFGPGRKSLIPSFCNLHGLQCTGSNAYVVSLCRHKYHVNKILSQHGISVPETWLYFHGWNTNGVPPNGKKVIIKPIYESASIGIDRDAIQIYDPHIDELINKKMHIHRQPILVQEFIEGYEAETPIIRIENETYSCGPVGISVDNEPLLGDNFLDYERIYFDKYTFYNFEDLFRQTADINKCAKTAANILGIEGLGRIDFRIKPDGSFYVTDVSTNPHFVSHSSVSFAFKKRGLNELHIAKTVLGATIKKGDKNDRVL